MLATALACLPILSMGQIISHIRIDEFDAWLFAYYGRQMTRGDVLYEQLWDNKPPGIFWLNAAASWLSGGSLVGIIVVCAAATVGACVVFFALTRRLYGLWTAAVSTFMAAVYLYQHYFHVGCNRPSTFFVVAELLAVLLYVRAVTRPASSWRSWAAVGFAAGVGVWFHQSALAAIGAIGLHQVLLVVARRQAAGVGLRRTATMAGGWLAAVLLAGLILIPTGDLAWAWHAVVSFNRNYFSPGVGSQLLPEWFGLREQLAVLALPVMIAIATLLHAVAGRLGPAPSGPPAGTDNGTRPPMLLALLWAWMIAGTYLALIGPHQRLHYLGIALPPLCLLAAHGVHLFLASGRRIGGSYPPFYLLLGLLWCGYMMITPVRHQWHELNRQYYFRFEDPAPRPTVVLAELIHKRTAPEDRLFVWAYDPEVYFRAARPPAIRYIATEKAYQLGQAGQPVMDDIIALLEAAQPKALVIPADVVNRLDKPDSKDPLTYDDLADWLRANYDLCEEAKHKDLWLRK